MPFTLNLEDLPEEARKYGTVEVFYQEYEKYKEVCEEYERKIREQDKEITEFKEKLKVAQRFNRSYEETILEQKEELEWFYKNDELQKQNIRTKMNILKLLDDIKCMTEHQS